MTRAAQRCGRSSWKWYGVQSLYRFVALGAPKNPDASFVPDATLVEERIVLIKARCDKEALKKAKEEGRNYTGSTRFTNGYGQKVRVRMLKALEAYELDSFPREGEELFSAMEEIDASIPDERICERPIGSGESLYRNDLWRRYKFIDENVVRLILEHLEKTHPSSRSGNEHGR
jgi:hypothetical protein